jgi:hypothetical protein
LSETYASTKQLSITDCSCKSDLHSGTNITLNFLLGDSPASHQHFRTPCSRQSVLKHWYLNYICQWITQ